MRAVLVVALLVVALSVAQATDLAHAKSKHHAKKKQHVSVAPQNPKQVVKAFDRAKQMPSVYALMTEMLHKIVTLEDEVTSLKGKTEEGKRMRFASEDVETPVEQELDQVASEARFAQADEDPVPTLDKNVPLTEGAAGSGSGAESQFKCNPDGSVAVDDSQCPQTCPPCPNQKGKREVLGRTVRIVEYAPDTYPEGTPLVLFNSDQWLSAKLARQIRAVLTGQLARKVKEMEKVYNIQLEEDKSLEVAKELNALDKLKEQSRWKHMSSDEKIVLSLEKVLNEMGVDPEADTFKELNEKDDKARDRDRALDD